MVKYVLIDDYSEIYGIYSNRADAEADFMDFCEDYVYEVMMTEDPWDVFGKEEWDWREDYDYLIRDCARILMIAEAPYYD